MSDDAPVLGMLSLVVRDMDAAVAFYRLLGLDVPEGWRTATGTHHVTVRMPDGFTLDLDSVELAKTYDAGWREPDCAGSREIIGFSLPSRDAVDELYAAVTAAGHPGPQPPYDAFWGARYAVVSDPDGNHVGLMARSKRAGRAVRRRSERRVRCPRPTCCWREVRSRSSR